MKPNVIYKYEIGIVDVQVLYLPPGSKILSVIEQHGRVVLYAHVNKDAPNSGDWDKYVIYIFGTGTPATPPDNAEFISTVSTYDGNLIWHVFVSKED